MKMRLRRFGSWALTAGTLLGAAWLLPSALLVGAILVAHFSMPAALFIPEKLGLVEQPGPETKVSLIVPGQEEVQFVWAGTYQIYRNVTKNYFYKIVLVSQATGESVEVRALPRSGTPEELPLYEFEIEEPGDYTVTVSYLGQAPDNPEVLTILPYAGNQNATVAFFAAIAQVILVAVAGRGIYYLINRRKIQAEVALQEEKRNEFDNWLEEERQRKKRP